MRFFLRPLFLFFLIAATIAPALHAIHEHRWLPSKSPTAGDITKVVFGAGAFVALATDGHSDFPSFILRSTDGSHWEAVDFADLGGGELAAHARLRLKDITFGAGKFMAVAMPPEGSTTRILVSDDGSRWSMVGGLSDASPVGIAYVQDRFWLVLDQGTHLWSSNGQSWTAGGIAPPAVPVEFGEEVLMGYASSVFRGKLPADGGIKLSAYLLSGSVLGLAAGADRAVALTEDAKQGPGLAVSGDASLWMSFEREPGDFPTLVNLGGVFWAVGGGYRYPRSVISSRDGVRWADRSEGLGGAALRSIAAGNGVLVVVGDEGAIFTRSVNLPPAITGQPPAHVSLSAGHPLLLAVEAEVGEDPLVHWLKDGHPVPGAYDLTLRIPAVTEDDAGRYTVQLTTSAGSTESLASEVTIQPASSEPVSWRVAATLEGIFSRMAAGEGALFVLGHHGDFYDSLRYSSVEQKLPAAWSENGIHWHQAALVRGPKGRKWMAAGFARGQFWLGGAGEIALSRDGIAWRTISLGTGLGDVTLVGEHQGRLFATVGGNEILVSDDGESWSPWASFPVPWAGAYTSDGGRLTIASLAGVFQWDGEKAQRLLSAPQGAQPRLVRDGERFLHLARDARPHPLSLSGNLESWTELLGTLPGARDLIAQDGNFIAVGPESFQTSDDGVWWARRPVPDGHRMLNAVTVAGDMLYAVGDEGRVLRRPAALEPGFYQHPRSAHALRGQPLRLIARATGSEPMMYQWFYGDGQTERAIEGATDPILEIEEIAMEQAGSYYARATNAVGSVRSEPATVDVSLRSPVAEPWEPIGEIPAFPEYSAAPTSMVRGNGRILALDPEGPTISISQDGEQWVRTRAMAGGPGVHTDGFAERLFHAGDRFFAAGGDQLAASVDGVAWELLPFPGPSGGIAYGTGVWVFGSDGPLGPAPYWSHNLKTRAPSPGGGGFHIAFGNGRFVGINRAGGTVLSYDGKQWMSSAPLPRDQAADQNLSSTLPPERVGIAYGNDYFVLLVTLDGTPRFYRSDDGKLWEGSSSSLPVYQLTFQGGNFWRSTLGQEGEPSSTYRLSASSDGRRWVDRQANLPGEVPPKIVLADDYDIIALAGRQAYRRPTLLEPVFYPHAGDYVVYPGHDLVIPAPEFHGSSATYHWFKDGSPLGSALYQEIQDANADTAGVYRVTANNPSGGNAIEFLVHFVGGYEDWAEVYHLDGEVRQAGEDPGGVGVANLLRYALSLDPESPDRSRLPRIGLMERSGRKFATLEFQLLDGVEDYEWWLEASPDLVQWSNIHSGYIEESERVGNIRKVIARDVVSLEDQGSRFLRLRIKKSGTSQ